MLNEIRFRFWKKNLTLLFAVLLLHNFFLFAQETTITLPTNANTSSFNITKENGISVFKADGSGKITGDGSGLSNVKPVAAYSGGDMTYDITANYGVYNLVKSVTINTPEKGIIIVNATGYVDFYGAGDDDYILLGIVAGYEGDPNNNYSAETKWYNYLNILSDYKYTDVTNQFASFTNHRGFTVSAGGNYTFNLWVNKYSTSVSVRVHDVNMTAMYFPTGGTGNVAMPGPSSNEMDVAEATPFISGTIDGYTIPDPNEPDIKSEEWINAQKRYVYLKEQLDELEQLTEILESKRNGVVK